MRLHVNVCILCIVIKKASADTGMAIGSRSKVCDMAALSGGCQTPRWQSLLEVVCQHCFDSSCYVRNTLLKTVVNIWNSFTEEQGGDVAKAECVDGITAVAIVLLHQMFDFRETQLSIISRLESHPAAQDMTPFPFSRDFLRVYANFFPTRLLSEDCDEGDSMSAKPSDRKTSVLPLFADLNDAQCPVTLSDLQFVRRCRARNAKSTFGISPKEATASGVKWVCPKGNKTQMGTGGKYDTEKIRHCATGHGSWGARLEAQLKCVAVVVGDLLQIQRGSTVLDWGSGCGWTLTWLHTFYGANGYGIDASNKMQKWSQQYSSGQYCQWGDTELSWVPEAAFDHVVSYWSLYHLPSARVQCLVASQLLLKLKPGGRAWFGGNNPSPVLNINHREFSRGDWNRCLARLVKARKGIAFEAHFVMDGLLFRSFKPIDKHPYKPSEEELRGDYLFLDPTYSALITRLA